MSAMKQFFQPPLYWQQFEDLTEGVFQIVFSDPKPMKVGRPGQSQHGVDVYGYENGNGRLIAIQCKRMDEMDENNNPFPGGVVTQKILNEEIAKVRKLDASGKPYWPGLDTWILATTAKRDANIQKYARALDYSSRAAGSFGIQIWFWDDFVTDLNRHHPLQDQYYKQVIQVRSADDQDRLILELIGEAFSRAAFRTPLHLETPDEFLDALKDTQCALNTGELKDRQTRRVIRKAIGGRRAITDQQIATQLHLASEKLQDLREQFQQAIGTNVIQHSGAMLIVPHQLQVTLVGVRDEAVAAVNAALLVANLPPI